MQVTSNPRVYAGSSQANNGRPLKHWPLGRIVDGLFRKAALPLALPRTQQPVYIIKTAAAAVMQRIVLGVVAQDAAQSCNTTLTSELLMTISAPL